jgi:outer membrane receptor for ferrienterochelin and colicins
MRKIVLTAFSIFLVINILNARDKTDAHIVGHVESNDNHIPFVNIVLKGTTIGTVSDENGQFRLMDIPEGNHIIVTSAIGYKPSKKEVAVKAGHTIEVNFHLQEDILGLEEVVITGDRNEKRRSESSVIVNTLTPKIFKSTQSKNLNEGLNFVPGLRSENNCQNCGFSQVRMNGLEGPYSQILINGRPIFSGLAGVYGLELIPSNMIERVEVVRGGGSALYGSNAIAGTINVILKDPISNSYELEVGSASIGSGFKQAASPAQDHHIAFNSSLVTKNNKSGISIYGNYRNRDPFDANDDGFSDLVSLSNTTVGTRIFHRFGHRSRISADFFNIREDRRGGDKFDLPLHESNTAEAVEHVITTGALTYDKFFREIDLLSVYASVQKVDRDSYYGANQSLADYGNTKDISYHIGGQYKASIGSSTLLVGAENQTGWLNDQKLGYPDLENAYMRNDSLIVPHVGNTTVANQTITTTGSFVQYEYKLNKFTTSVGVRYDHYNVEDNDHENKPVSGNVLSPRINMLYDITSYLQARISYSQGYRAPQIFDEDLHIETSGSRKVLHENSSDLKQETSHSYMASLDLNKTWKNSSLKFLTEAFYTRLIDPFANEFGHPDENGTVVYTRVNAEKGAYVKGMNFELMLIPQKNLLINSGFTVQTGKYDEPHEFDSREFFRSPSVYGYVMLDLDVGDRFCMSTTGNYTGSMYMPYFGPQLLQPEEGELRKTEPFYDVGLKLKYNLRMKGTKIQVYSGIKNILNSYQSDLDSGESRDPAYVYGPAAPRTIYLGLKFGNLLDQ